MYFTVNDKMCTSKSIFAFNLCRSICQCNDTIPHLRGLAPGQFWPYPLRDFLLIQSNGFLFCIHTTHEGAMYRTPFSGQKFKDQGHMGRVKFWPWPPVASSLFERITSYVTYMQHASRRYVAYHFQDERSKVKVTLFICVMCALWFSLLDPITW